MNGNTKTHENGLRDGRIAALGIAEWAIAEARAMAPDAVPATAKALIDEIISSPGRGLAVLLPAGRRARIGPLARWLLDSMLPNDRIKTPPT